MVAAKALLISQIAPKLLRPDKQLLAHNSLTRFVLDLIGSDVQGGWQRRARCSPACRHMD